MDAVQIYSMLFFSLTLLILFVQAGVAIEKDKTFFPLMTPFISIILWTPFVGRLFKLW